MALAPAVMKERMNNVRGVIEKMKAEIGAALPEHLTADRMARVTLTAIQTTPKLLECDQKSLLQAIMTAAQLGLEPDGVLGQAYLIPYGDKVQFIPGYKGLITLAFNSGQVASLSAHEVCENDEFSWEYGMNEHLRHKPALKNRGPVIAFYACSKLKSGAFIFEVMSVEEVEKIRDASQGYKSYQRNKTRYPNSTSPWVEHFIQMGRKTLIRRLVNYLPRSVQKPDQPDRLQQAALIEQSFEAGRPAALNDMGEMILLEATTVDEGEAVETKPAATSTMDALAGPAEEAPKEDPKPARTRAAKPKDEPKPEPAREPDPEPDLPAHDPDTGEIQDDDALADDDGDSLFGADS